MAKEHLASAPKYFSQYNFPDTAEKFINKLDEHAKSIGYDKLWNSICNAQDNLIITWNRNNDCKLFWAQFLVKNYGYLLWNYIYITTKNENNAYLTMNNFLKKYK